MPPIKPGRWTINPADIDQRFLRLWWKLDFLCPFDYSLDNVAGPGRVTGNFPVGASWGKNRWGVGLNHDSSSGGAITVEGYTPPGDENDAPFAVLELVDNLTYPTTNASGHTTLDSNNGWLTKLEQFDGSNKLGFTKKGVVDITSSIDSPTGPSLIIYNVRPDASIDFYLYDFITGTWTEDESQTDTSAWTTGGTLKLLSDGSIKSPAVDLGLAAIWRRNLDQTDRDLLALDTFGLIRSWDQGLQVSAVERFIRTSLVSRKPLRKDAQRLASQGLISAGKST